MNPLPARPAFYSIRALADLTGLPAVTLRRLCHAGQLAHCRRSASDGSKRPVYYVPRDAVQRLLDGMAADAARSVLPAPEQSRVRPIARAPRGRPRKSA